MSNLSFSLELAQQFYASTEQFPIDFDDARMWLEFSSKGNAKRSFLRAGFIEGVDFCSFFSNEKREVGATQVEIIKLTCECFKQWGMMAGTEKGKQIRFYFLECERIAKSRVSQPQLTAVQETITNIDSLVSWITKTDAEQNLLEQAKYDTVASIHPEYRPLLEAAKKVRSTEFIHSSVGMTVTQVGEKLNPRMSAVKLNRVLEEMGLQYRDFSGKKPVWQLTESGKEHGFVYFATNDDKWSGDQIRWQDSVISEIKDYLGGEEVV